MNQVLNITLKEDGIEFYLENTVAVEKPETSSTPAVLKLTKCVFPWETVTTLEFGGDCKRSWGNWRNFSVSRIE